MVSTLILTPGSFATPSMYDSVVTHLDNAGIADVRVVHTPSVGPYTNSRRPGSMCDDAAAIVAAAEAALSEGKEVVLLAHSYGGIPQSQALEKLLPGKRGDGKGGVKKVIYLASVVLQEGVSNFDLFGENLPEFVKKDQQGGFMTLDLAVCAPLTFSQLPAEEAIKVAEASMGPHSIAAFDEKLTFGGYHEAEEVHWILCEEDKIVPPEFQKGFVDMINAGRKIKEEGDGRRRSAVKVHARPWDHAPTHSDPKGLVAIVKEVMGA